MTTSDNCLDNFGFAQYQNSTSFAKDQLSYYCLLYTDFDHFSVLIDKLVGISMAFVGILGFLNYVLTFATFSRGSSFKGPSYVYHLIMAVVELFHTAVMFQYGVLRSLDFPGGYNTIFWLNQFWGGWMFGDAAKLCVLCLTGFVSLERMIAVWLPTKFGLINRYPVAAAAAILSGLIGSLHLISIAAVKVVLLDSGVYSGDKTEFGNSSFYAFLEKAIYFIKLSLGVFIIIACVIIVCGITVQQKRSANMTTDAKQSWKNIKMGCYLQLIVAITALIDQAAWVAFKMVDQPYPLVGAPAVQWLQYQDAVDDLRRMRKRIVFETVQVLTGELDHGGRFYFYLVFHAGFRRSFRFMWKKICSKKTKVETFARTK